MAKAVSSTFELVDSVISNSVTSFDFIMCALASRCFQIELVPGSDWWWRTWNEMMDMMPWLLVSSILQCISQCYEGAWLELFQATEHFVSPFMEAYKVSNMICKVRLLKLRIKKHWFLDDMITFSHKVFEHVESDMVLGIWMLCNLSWDTVKTNVTVKYSDGS